MCTRGLCDTMFTMAEFALKRDGLDVFMLIIILPISVYILNDFGYAG